MNRVLHNPPVHSFEVDVVKLAVGDVEKPALVQDHRHHVPRHAELQTNLEQEGKNILLHLPFLFIQCCNFRFCTKWEKHSVESFAAYF